MGDFDCCETQAQVRAAALLAGVDAHYAREQKRSDELESARAWAVALENRLAEVTKWVTEAAFSPKAWRTPEGYLMQVWSLLDSELVAE